MKNFIVYDGQGKILRTGICQNSTFLLQAKEDEFIMEGVADDVTQKITNVGIKGKVIDKTPEEIEAGKPSKLESVPFEKQQANITNEQWQDVLDRLSKLEAEA